MFLESEILCCALAASEGGGSPGHVDVGNENQAENGNAHSEILVSFQPLDVI